MVLLRGVPIYDCALMAMMKIYRVAPLGYETINTTMRYLTQSIYPDTKQTNPRSILGVVMLTSRARLDKKCQFPKQLVW